MCLCFIQKHSMMQMSGYVSAFVTGTGCAGCVYVRETDTACEWSHITAQHELSMCSLPCVKRLHSAIIDAVCLVLSLLPLRPTNTHTHTVGLLKLRAHSLTSYSNLNHNNKMPEGWNMLHVTNHSDSSAGVSHLPQHSCQCTCNSRAVVCSGILDAF